PQPRHLSGATRCNPRPSYDSRCPPDAARTSRSPSHIAWRDFRRTPAVDLSRVARTGRDGSDRHPHQPVQSSSRVPHFSRLLLEVGHSWPQHFLPQLCSSHDRSQEKRTCTRRAESSYEIPETHWTSV